MTPNENENQIRNAIQNPGLVVMLPPIRLAPRENQPRQTWIEEDVLEMARSVVAFRRRGLGINGSGFIHPIKVALPPGAIDASGEIHLARKQLPINSGETKWRAASLLATDGVEFLNDNGTTEHVQIEDIEAPVMVEDVNSSDADDLAYAENALRRNLNPLDEADFLARKAKELNLTYRGLAARYGKSLAYIGRRMSARAMSDESKALLRARPDALSVALKIDEVKDENFRQKLIDDAIAGAGLDTIAPLVTKHHEEKAASAPALPAPPSAPDAETARRAKRNASSGGLSGGGGGMSRGREITGVDEAEAREHVTQAMDNARANHSNARAWVERLTPSRRQRLAERAIRELEQEVRTWKGLLGNP
jgi:ParB-like chromosome segregation protein Spo0J